jgi:hypothetical protein
VVRHDPRYRIPIVRSKGRYERPMALDIVVAESFMLLILVALELDQIAQQCSRTLTREK